MGHSAKVHSSILSHSFGAAAVGVPGAFAAHADVPILIGIWAKMIFDISKKSEKDMSWQTAGRIATGVGAAVGTFAVTGKIANSYFALSGIGTPLAILFNAGTNGAATYVIGDTCAKLISKDQLEAGDIIKAVLSGLSLGASDQVAGYADDLFKDWAAKHPGPK